MMTYARRYVMTYQVEDSAAVLTKEEMEAGYHFCYEWDGLVCGPGFDEACSCEREDGSYMTPRCGACNGSGWVVRDPDIGTEQECGCK